MQRIIFAQLGHLHVSLGLQAIKSPNLDTSQLDAAYDTLRDENKRRAYDQRHKGGASSSAPKASKREEGFEVVERGSGELQDWAQSSAQAGGDGKSEAVSLANVAGLLSEAVSGGRLCAPLVAALRWLRPVLQCGLMFKIANCDKHGSTPHCMWLHVSLTFDLARRYTPKVGFSGLHNTDTMRWVVVATFVSSCCWSIKV